MKKITLFLAAFFMLATASLAETQPAVTFNWAHTVDGATSAGDNIIGMVKASGGDYYVATTWGTNSRASQVTSGLTANRSLAPTAPPSWVVLTRAPAKMATCFCRR